MASASGRKLQYQLRSAVQSLQWTYSLFWRLCHEQGILVWGDGYYNGAIKTRKTVQPVEVSAEEASLQRSQQLRELYETLSAGPETSTQPARRPCAALSPEDLTESEWFYLMCVSFSFPPGTGLPGKAIAEQQHVWMTKANEADSKFFPRAILAKSAGIRTVICIPLAEGVLELGTTEKVEEDMGIIQKARSFFVEKQETFNIHHHNQPKPARSEHSTSNIPAAASSSSSLARSSLFHSPPLAMIKLPNANPPLESNQDSDLDVGNGEEDIGGLGSEENAAPASTIRPADQLPSEIMAMEMSSDIPLGSPDDCSNNFDMDMPVVALDPNMVTAGRRSTDGDQQRVPHGYHHHSVATTGFKETYQLEDAHYSQTVSAIMQRNAGSSSSIDGHLSFSGKSAFSGWSHREGSSTPQQPEVASQYQLKYVLFTVPFLYGLGGKDGDDDQRFRKGTTPQDELSASHVLAERRRREKLNERFVILRSLVPFVTKMDKASILGDTIEYVKQLRRRIQELESRGNKQTTAAMDRQRPKAAPKPTTIDGRWFKGNNAQLLVGGPDQRSRLTMADRRMARVVLEGGMPTRGGVQPSSNVLQVSIIEADALLELRCPYRESLLLMIIQRLHELRLEVTSIQSSSGNDTLVAEIRAKVKEDIHGKRASIVEVKKAIHLIFSSYQCYSS